MFVLTRRSLFGLGLCWGLLWCGLGSETALAQPGNFPQGNENLKDATKPLAERIEMEKAGRELFLRDWSKADAKPAPGGDGLGPMYNDVSCVACHDRGGIGGGGSLHKNVRLLHLVGHNGVPLRIAKTSPRDQSRLQQLHPDLVSTTSAMLHRHAIGRGDKQSNDVPQVSDPEYQHWLAKRLPASMVNHETHLPAPATVFPFESLTRSSPLESQPGTFRSAGQALRVTERNTTSLFGAGLIDSIPDAAIVELAERQKQQHAPLITGRVPQTASGAIGRFGWRGQTASLQEFVMTACAVEVGLNVPGHQQSQRVLLPTQTDSAPNPEFMQQPGLDLTQPQCDALTMYVSGLPAPKSARASTLNQAKSVQRGAVLFEKSGCAICHVRDVGPAIGLFSDLLLHDMGPGLSDPSPAMPELKENTTLSPGGSYFGPSLSLELVKHVTTNIHQEWRTPPLWGVATSAPYLHDGRAASLEHAIQWHGGEGQRAAEAFRSLKPDERRDLLLFLQSLGGEVLLPMQFQGGGGGAGFF
ncbi:MAG: di-heme oxidoredictase family protein [Planctomycetaceae bacterium]